METGWEGVSWNKIYISSYFSRSWRSKVHKIGWVDWTWTAFCGSMMGERGAFKGNGQLLSLNVLLNSPDSTILQDTQNCSWTRGAFCSAQKDSLVHFPFTWSSLFSYSHLLVKICQMIWIVRLENHSCQNGLLFSLHSKTFSELCINPPESQ